MQIIVLGPHRSGTSLTTRLINMMGAYFGSDEISIGANEENPKGFWERRDVVELNDRILAHFGCTWDDFSLWTHDGSEHSLPDLPVDIMEAMRGILAEMNANRPWVMKDPRTCQTFPFWLRELETPIAIIVHRDPLEVAVSLQKRNGHALHHGVAIWEFGLVSTLNATRSLPSITIHHAEVLADPVKTTQRLYEELTRHGVTGLRLPEASEIEAFVEKSLHRSKLEKSLEPGLLNASQLALAAIAESGSPTPDSLTYSLGARDAMAAYHRELVEYHPLQNQLVQMRDEHSEAEGRYRHRIEDLERELKETHITLLATQQEKERQHREIMELGTRYQDTEEQRAMAANELEAIKNTRLWRMRSKLVGSE